MKDLSLYVLDITMNSVKAGASHIYVSLVEDNGWLTFTVSDDGCGMSAEVLARVSDPFFTSRTTRKVGLGVPFLRLLAEQTGGSVEITSKSETEFPDDHGTTTKATFDTTSIDFIPLGDIVSTVITLIQGSPDRDFRFTHETPRFTVSLDTAELREALGDVSLAEPEVLEWIREYLEEQYAQN
jgi:signal transduction histidine kinase